MQRPGGEPALEWNSERALKTKPKKTNQPTKQTNTNNNNNHNTAGDWVGWRNKESWKKMESGSERQDSQMKEQMESVQEAPQAAHSGRAAAC